MKFFKFIAYKQLLFLIIFCGFSQQIPAQNNGFDQKKVEKLLWEQSTNLSNNGKYDDAIKLNQKLIKESENIDFQEGIVKGYCNLGNIFGRMGKYKESFLLLKLAEKENERIQNPELKASIFSESGRNYSSLGLYTQALEYFQKAISVSEGISDIKKKNTIRNFSYSNIVFIHSIQNRKDLAFRYSKIMFNEVKDSYNSITMAYYYVL